MRAHLQTTPPATLQVALLLIASLTIMAGTIVAPALPAIREAFAGQKQVDLLSRMVLTLPAVFVAACAPLAGALADRFGRKRLLLFFVLLYALAGTSGLYANSLTAVLIGRAILGISIGGIVAAFWGLIAGVITHLILNGNVKSWFGKKKNTQPLA